LCISLISANSRYTSPHLIDWRERICVNEQAIAPLVLRDVLHQVQAAIHSDAPSPTQFEVITAAAWLYFAQQEVDLAVMEVGLGGRLDATNVCDRPLVTIITSLSREHWQRLGYTLAEIAYEKAGILKPGCPAMIGPLPAEARKVVEQRVQECGCPATWVHPAQDLGDGWARYDSSRSTLADHDPVDADNIGINYPLPLLGAHQLINSALAIAALQVLQEQGWSISSEAVVNGMAHTEWPGRLQWINWKQHRLLIDGAHNPAAAKTLRQFIDHIKLPISSVHWVMGMLSTKDHADVFQELLRPGDRLSLVPVPDHSSAHPASLAELAWQQCPDLKSCAIYGDVEAALQKAVQPVHNLDQSDNLVVLCGSLYLIGYFLRNT
jgi:dihydrofolate synthase/folylpolyglutamate synthase